jgi:hypothetical protein
MIKSNPEIQIHHFFPRNPPQLSQVKTFSSLIHQAYSSHICGNKPLKTPFLHQTLKPSTFKKPLKAHKTKIFKFRSPRSR